MRVWDKESVLRKLTPKDPGDPRKYLNIILCSEEGQITRAIHRLVAESFVDGYFHGAVVNHIDGNNRNNRATNLEWVTQKDNIHKSYITSSVDQTRNYKWWKLYDSTGVLIGTFKGHKEMKSYVEAFLPNVSISSLVKYHKASGYHIEQVDKQCV